MEKQNLKVGNVETVDPKEFDNLHKKIHGVMAEIEAIEKRGWNENQSYKFAQETDFVEKVKPLLTKYRLTMLPTCKSMTIREYGEDKSKNVKPTFLTSVEMEYEITCIDTQKSKTIIIPGTGTDNRDKGLYKAMTGSKKYSYALAFHISTGADPESSPDGEKKNTKVVTKPGVTKTPAKSGKKASHDF